MTTRIRNINPLQYAIVVAVLYALIGVIVGICFGLFSMAAGAMFRSGGMPGFGWLSVIIFPILYAVLGFIIGLIVSFLYNVVAGWTGGIELTFSTTPVSTTAIVP